MVGVSHRTTPVEVRESLWLPAAEVEEVLASVVSTSGVAEAFLLSTCNRCELYLALSEAIQESGVRSLLAQMHKVNAEQLVPYCYTYEGLEAVKHLLAVACGADSMVLGESEIMSQVKEAGKVASLAGAAGTVLSRLTDCALAAGKRARTETAISQGHMSVASVAIDLARQVFDDLSQAKVLVLGAGQTSEQVVRELSTLGVHAVVVSNRTYDRALELTKRFGGRAVPFDDFRQEMATTDIVITSTAAPHAVIRAESLRQQMRRRGSKPLFIVDLGVPRDVEPGVSKIQNVFLYDIDHLEQVVQRDLQERRKELPKVWEIVTQEALRFWQWLGSRSIIDTIRALREQAEEVRQTHVSRALQELPNLNKRDERIIQSMSKRIVRGVLEEPLKRLQILVRSKDGFRYVDAVREFFGLKDMSREKKG